MKASDYVKSKGVYSLKTLAEHYGFHADTLSRWYANPKAKINKLDPLIDRYHAEKKEA